jgi:CHAD domain-containing protein
MKKLRARIRAAGPLERRLDPVIQVCCDSLAALADRKQDPAKNVHQLRKNGKRLRGGLELLGAPKPVITELRDLGRMLAVARDSRVRVSTFETLCDRVGDGVKADPDFEVAVRQLGFEAQLGGAPPGAVRRFAGSRLEAVAQWLEGAEFGDAGGVARRMRRLISEAKQHLKVIAAKPDKLEDYHEGRKAVKALLGAAEFLFEDPEPEFRRELRRLDRLGEDLGWVQDLDVFDGWLDDHGLTTARMPVLHQVMQREIRKACRAARRRASKCDPDLFRGKG